jgi:hypothetical protein
MDFISEYARITMPNMSQAATFTEREIQGQVIKDEISVSLSQEAAPKKWSCL